MSQSAEDIRQTLVTDGPQFASDLSTTASAALPMADGVEKFNPYSRDMDPITAGQCPIIYYIGDHHAPKTVIQMWLDRFDARDAVSDWSLHKRFLKYGEGFKEASRELLGPFENGGDNTGGVCDLCGDEYHHSLAQHLKDGCGRGGDDGE